MSYEGVWRAKGIAEEAATMDELIQRLEEEAEQLREMKAAGVKLSRPVEDDYAFLTTEDAKVAKRYGFGLEEEV